MSPERARFHSIRRVLIGVLVLNWIVAGIKIALGLMTNSLSVLSDGFHSLLDGASNIIGLVAIGIARRPPDADHPYGHRKFEALAAMAICFLLGLTCWEILRGVILRLIHGMPEFEVTPLAIGVIAATIVVNIGITVYERRRGRELRSPILVADAAHTMSDVYASTVALATLVAIQLGWPWVDLFAAVVIVGLIAHAGWEIVTETLLTLADAQRLDPDEVAARALEVKGVLTCTDVRSRGLEDEIHVEMVVEVAPEISAAATEAIEHGIEDHLKSRWPEIVEVRVHHHTARLSRP